MGRSRKGRQGMPTAWSLEPPGTPERCTGSGRGLAGLDLRGPFAFPSPLRFPCAFWRPVIQSDRISTLRAKGGGQRWASAGRGGRGKRRGLPPGGRVLVVGVARWTSRGRGGRVRHRHLAGESPEKSGCVSAERKIWTRRWIEETLS